MQRLQLVLQNSWHLFPKCHCSFYCRTSAATSPAGAARSRAGCCGQIRSGFFSQSILRFLVANVQSLVSLLSESVRLCGLRGCESKSFSAFKTSLTPGDWTDIKGSAEQKKSTLRINGNVQKGHHMQISATTACAKMSGIFVVVVRGFLRGSWFMLVTE